VPATQAVTSQDLIGGYRQLIVRAHKSEVRIIGTTIPPFEHALFRNPLFESFYTSEKEKSRQEVNAWIRNSTEFDGVIDFDAAVRDPNHPTQLLPAYDSGDHLHVNDAGNVAQGNAISLALFKRWPLPEPSLPELTSRFAPIRRSARLPPMWDRHSRQAW
jgi:hypothetical protein